MFPHAEKCREIEARVHSLTPGQFWIVCMTNQGGGHIFVDFVLSCTEGPLGSYPIFIFTTIPHGRLTSDPAASRISSLAYHLSLSVPTRRVFSVFAPEPVAQIFASIWTEHNGIPLDPIQAEYYAAKLMFCDRGTLREGVTSPELRRAVVGDIPKAAQLCYEFAAKSTPFVLSRDKAHQEATILVQNGQLWVHEITIPGEGTDIASIVAVTRTSETVAAITKVYTNPTWRSRGCAERLTRRVCAQLLETKLYVVLYVAHDNPAAARVYEKVGFVKFDEPGSDVPGAERWLELGFDRRRVDLGHW
ncbi:unnamed protein product [Somion occarium]|uniref:N-acetyltransferase domain-containing protein n=1 Tax=Somion occarium TaxID=3059160 RepID=A0ABP1CKK3_9APHY